MAAAHVSPTKRTLDKLREDGYLPWITEHWNAYARKRQDLYGFVDVLAVRENETLAVQCTSGSNVASRVAKIAQHENVGALRKAGWVIQVWGWRKNKAGKWDVRIVDCS